MRFIVLAFYLTSIQIAAAFVLDFVSNFESRNGYGWPHTVRVMVGHDALLKLGRKVINQESCLITTAQGLTFDISSPPVPNKYERWGDDSCGVRLKQLTHADAGRWRITAVRGNFNITGFSDVFVVDKVPTSANPPINLEDGGLHAVVNLTTYNSQYCVVTQPFAESSLIPGHCLVTLDRATRAVQGTWDVVLGIAGRVQEYNMQRQVAVEAERLDVGYVHDSASNKLHLYCNILNSHMEVSFCRFQMTSKPTGYNVLDGLSDGDYSYYGEGFSKKQCGLTVEHPTAADYGTWRCSVGVRQVAGTAVLQRTPMQALITVPADTRLARSKKHVEEAISRYMSPTRQIFVRSNEEMSLSCRAEVSLSYCWFQAPNDDQYTPVVRNADDVGEPMDFWYTGQGLSMGDCGITFSKAKTESAGNWTCHMGPSQQLGLELTETLQVRITGALAAETKEIYGTEGNEATLYCLSAGGNRPLTYCRFLMPNGVGIHVDETVTAEKSILGRFYFTPNRSLNHGDCSLTVTSLSVDDVGEWTCAALVSQEVAESRDTIHLYLDEPDVDTTPASRRLSRASVAGLVMGCLISVVILAGIVWYKYGRPLSSLWPRQQTNEQSIDVQYQVSRDSLSSDGSDVSRNDIVSARHWQVGSRNVS